MAEAKKFKRLKAIRISHRGVVDDLLGEANELTCVDSLSEIQSGRIEVINTLLENKLKSLKEIGQEILNICELTAVVVCMYIFKNSFIHAMCNKHNLS